MKNFTIYVITIIFCFIIILLGYFRLNFNGTCYDDELTELEIIMNNEEIKSIEKDVEFIQSTNPSVSYKISKELTNIIKEEIINYDWIEYEFYLSLIAQETKFKKLYFNDSLYCEENSCIGAKYGRGIAQVSEIGLTEYNNRNHTNYTPNELYNVKINIKISMWLLNKYHYGYDYDGNYFERSVENTSLIYNNGYVIIRGTEQQKSKCNFNYYKDIMNLYKSWVN